MSNTLLTSSSLDKNGRKVVLDDSILSVAHYDASDESWDKQGISAQSWAGEINSPSDTFDSGEIIPNKWLILNSVSGNTVSQSSGVLKLEIIKSEGKSAISSASLWRLTGDFEARLYMDWESYYNEYRGIADSYLTLGYNTENQVRLSFSFNGSGYEFRSLKSIQKDPTFFGWSPNGPVVDVVDISKASSYEYLKITRSSGILSFYAVDGSTETKVGDDIDESDLYNDLTVELGIQTSQFNTYKHSFSKVFFSGAIEPPTEFFSENRGPTSTFPDKSILSIDSKSLSIIDEADYTLWARFLFEEGSALLDSNTRVSASNGSVFCATASGIVVLDFQNDSIYRYRGSGRQVASEPISMRNSTMSYRTDAAATGTLPVNSFTEISSITIGGQQYAAAVADDYVVTIKHLASGIGYTQDGTGELSRVTITPAGTLYWSGYNASTNIGQVSYKNSLVSEIPTSGESVFSRTDYYGTGTSKNIISEVITCFDILDIDSTELLAVGSTEGITFIASEPAADFSGAVTFGVEASTINPIVDPSFESPIGLNWKPQITGLHSDGHASRSSNFPGNGTNSLLLQWSAPDVTYYMYYEKDAYVGVYQEVDFTGVSYVYFDLYYDVDGSIPGLYSFEAVINGKVVKTFVTGAASITKLNDSIEVIEFGPASTLLFRLKLIGDTSNSASGKLYIDNLRTSLGSPDYRVLPAGDVSINEILLQYDTTAHKIYYSTLQGYGAVDLYSNTLSFFEPVAGIVPGSSIQSAEFSRDDNEV